MSALTDQMRALVESLCVGWPTTASLDDVSDAIDLLRTAADRIDAQDAALTKVRAAARRIKGTPIISAASSEPPVVTLNFEELVTRIDAVLALIDTEGEPQ